MFEDFSVFVQHDGIVCVRDQPGFGVNLSDGFIHPMQGN
jgi:hypothetical protein